MIFQLFCHHTIKSKIFADDFKCYSKAVTSDDLETFSRALNSISQWARDWQLPISTEKSALMLFSHSMELVGGQNLRLDDQILTSLSKTLDLGVTFDSDLKFKSQINIACGKAKQRLYLLRKKIITTNPDLLIMVYKMYVLPILMYCSPIWSPQTYEDCLKLEKIQKKFTKTLVGYGELSYAERLVKANMKSLELNRLLADLILCYKILHDLVDIDKANIFDFEPYNSVTRSHGLKLRALKPKCNTALFSYGYRVTKLWNGLSANAVWAPTLNLFKKYLYDEDFSDSLLLKFDTF